MKFKFKIYSVFYPGVSENSLKIDSLHLIEFLEKIDFRESNKEGSIAYFRDYISSRPGLLNYDRICPLLIVITGLWSSNRKKARYRKSSCRERVDFYELCLREMMIRGVNVNIHQNHRHMSTAMHWLIAWDRPVEGCFFLDMLKEYKLPWNSNARDNLGNTSLTLLVARKYFGRRLSCEREDHALIKKMLQRGADALSHNDDGNTAVHYSFVKRDIEAFNCIASTNQETCTLLMTVKNNFKQTPVDLLNLNYKEAGAMIRKVYEASKLEEMMPKERWKRDRAYFRSFSNGYGVYDAPSFC